jgi:hypothetical protein
MTEQNAGFDHVVEDLAAIAGVQKSSRLLQISSRTR